MTCHSKLELGERLSDSQMLHILKAQHYDLGSLRCPTLMSGLYYTQPLIQVYMTNFPSWETYFQAHGDSLNLHNVRSLVTTTKRKPFIKLREKLCCCDVPYHPYPSTNILRNGCIEIQWRPDISRELHAGDQFVFGEIESYGDSYS